MAWSAEYITQSVARIGCRRLYSSPPCLASWPQTHIYMYICSLAKERGKKKEKYVERLPFELKKRDEARDNIIYIICTYIHNAYYKMKQECGVMYVVNKM